MILIAGGTGHLGTELIPLLTARGLLVRVLTRKPVSAVPVVSGVEFRQADVRDPGSIAASMAGVTAVVSAISGFGPGGAGPRTIDHQGNANLIHEAEAAGVRHFVLVSMHRARADHPMELLRMKHRAEQTLLASRLEWTIVRPTVFMELWTDIVGRPLLKTGKAVVFGHGDNPINFISVRDVARVIERALVDPGLRRSSLEIGGPENLTLNEVVQILERSFGRRGRVRHIPLLAVRLSALLMRPVRPDLAGLIEAGISMDTVDMSFHPSALENRLPNMSWRRLEEVARSAARDRPSASSALDIVPPRPGAELDG